MNSLQQKVDDINIFLKKQPWMDFEIENYSQGTLIIRGYIDFLESYQIEICFKNVFALETTLSWKTNTSIDVMTIVTGIEGLKINKEYYVEQGYTIFSIITEDKINQIFISKELEYKIIV